MTIHVASTSTSLSRRSTDGTGQWIELSLSNAAVAAAAYKFADSGDLAMNSRLAADAVGATRMERPEWSAVHPASGEIYYTLTNNANRKLSPTGSQQGLDAVNPKTGFAFIQTDDGAYTDVTNCMMLIGRAGKVGDGTTPTLSTTRLTLRTHPST